MPHCTPGKMCLSEDGYKCSYSSSKDYKANATRFRGHDSGTIEAPATGHCAIGGAGLSRC